MPPKKKLPDRAGNGVKLGNGISKTAEASENSVLASSSSLKRKGSKISSLLGKTKKSNNSSFISSQSSMSDLENDGGFFFQRLSKPALNKTNILSSISESQDSTINESAVPSKSTSRSQSSSQQRTKVKASEVSRASSRNTKPLSKKLTSSIPNKSKLLDIDSESEIEGDIENSFAPLILADKPKSISNLKSKLHASKNDLIGKQETGIIKSKPSKKTAPATRQQSTSKKPQPKNKKRPVSSSQKEKDVAALEDKERESGRVTRSATKKNGFDFNGANESPEKPKSITTVRSKENPKVNAKAKSARNIKKTTKGTKKTAQATSKVTKETTSTKKSKQKRTPESQADILKGVGIQSDIPQELNLSSNAKLTPPVNGRYGSPGRKEPLQISESPINRRNKEMRAKSNRRSSLSNRGKRTSSIGNGFQVSPHDDVLPVNFFKHLNQDLPEPHRMRQLLTWCFKRQLSLDKSKQQIQWNKKQNNDDLIASNIAKVIKEEIIRDLVEGKVSTSWWNKSDDDAEEEELQPAKKKRKIKVVPNKQNQENEKSLKIFEARLAKLQKSNEEWDQLTKGYGEGLLENKLELDENDFEQENLLKQEILKSAKAKTKGKRKLSSRKSGEQTQEWNSIHESVVDGTLLDDINKKTKDVMEQIKENYEDSLTTFSNFVDKLNFNDSVIKNFEHNKKQHIAQIFKQYIESTAFEKAQRDKSDDANTQPAMEDTDDGQLKDYRFDNIELLRGITKIDKL